MEILWFAIVIYSIGLGILLHFRPAFMFHENGSWKEFGYQRDSRHTLFPFWLFAIAWAFMSYVLAATFVWSFFTAATYATYATSMNTMNTNMMNTNTMNTNTSNTQDDTFMMPASNVEDTYDDNNDEYDEYDDIEEDTKDVRIKNRNIHYEDSSSRTARPGYYIIDPKANNSGIRRYIYYGPNPPTD